MSDSDDDVRDKLEAQFNPEIQSNNQITPSQRLQIIRQPRLNFISAATTSNTQIQAGTIDFPTPKINMTHQQASAGVQGFDLNLLKFRLSAIKPYDGSPEGLNNFIFCCRKVLQYYDVPTLIDPDREILILHLKAKLQDRACLQLGTRNYNTFNDFFEDLRQSFSLGKDLNSYRGDILNAHKKANQSLLDFAYEIRRLLDLGCDFVQSQNYPPDEARTILRELETIAIEKIINFSHHDLNRHFFSIQPKSLLVVINEIQRDIAFTQRSNQIQRSYTPRIESYPRSQNIPHHRSPMIPPRTYQSPPPPRYNTPPPRPVNNYFYANNKGSGRYANSNVIRPNNMFQYPKPPNYQQNKPPLRDQSKMQVSANYRNPFGNNNNNFRPYNGYNNQFNNNFNRPPPKPQTAYIPTPMEVNNHDYYEPYYETEYPYEDPYFYPYEQNHGYAENFDAQYEYDSSQENNTEYIANELANVNLNESPNQVETENFPIPASESKMP